MLLLTSRPKVFRTPRLVVKVYHKGARDIALLAEVVRLRVSIEWIGWAGRIVRAGYSVQRTAPKIGRIA